MEEWKDIPNYEGIYEASNYGRIRTKEGKRTYSKYHGERIWKQRILKQKFQRRKDTNIKDARIILWKDGESKTFLVSRLIAMTWCVGYDESLTVNHIDGNPENNRCDNLEWISRRRNIQEGFQTGMYRTNQRKCTLVDDNGYKYHFDSLSDVSRFMGRGVHYASMCLNRGSKLVSDKGEVFKFAN